MIQKIKDKIFNLDLYTNMDEAKELTHFALTHQAITKEEKK